MTTATSKKVTFHENPLDNSTSPRFNLSESHHEIDHQINAYPSCAGYEYNNNINLRERTPQEMAGIMVHYPGITEYKRRYKWPISDLKFESIINPTYEGLLERVDFKKAEYVEQISEYNKRFKWPN